MMNIRSILAKCVGGVTVAALSLVALGQTSAPAPAASGDVLEFYTAGLEGVLVDPKDQVLVQAVRLLDQRLMELPRETGEDDMPAPALQLLLELLLGPMEWRAGLVDDMPKDGPPFYAQVDFISKDQQSAEATAGRFLGMVTSLGPIPPDAFQPAPEAPGMQKVNLDGPNGYFGALKRDGQPAFTLAVGKVNSRPISREAIGLPRGVKPAVTFSLDFKRLQPLFDMLMQEHGDEINGEAEFMKQHMQSMGIYGPDAMTIQAAFGHEADRARCEVRLRNLAKTLRASGSLPSRSVTAADLKRIPADATFAQISAFDFSSIGRMIERSMPPGEDAPDPMAMVEQVTGIHPQRDLFDHLGQVVGCYASDTTGGGGLMSMVMYMEVKNSDALNQTMSRMTATLNQMAKQTARGYVRIAERTVKNQKMHVLSFPGLPIPIELSCAIADGFLYAAASPQGLLAAIGQGKGGTSGLGDHPRFKEMGGGNLGDAVKVQFMDTPRLMRDGYGLVSLGVSALCNVVRSPTDSSRGYDLLMPSLAELSNGAKASVTITRVQGDDVIVSSQMDRSLLVNAAGCIGALGGSTGPIAMVALGSGILMPALGKARENAKSVKSMAQLRQISMGVMTYAAEMDDQMPASIDVLTEKNYFTPELLTSPFGPIYDEHGDYFFNLVQGAWASVKRPDRTIMGYDRAMLAERSSTAVLFYDGHVETLDFDDFLALIAEPQHEAVDFQLP